MSECVKVIVRCRPMNDREKGMNCGCVIGIDSERAACTIKNPADPKAPPKNFTFDGAYFTESTTEAIYNEIAYPLVEGVTEGYNGTIFAYGQTGCGKSFTMQGIQDPPTQRGIIPRAFDHIFETVSVSETMKFLIHASYLEIYNEEIRDLLGKDIKTKLDLHEHPEKGVYVTGLSMHPVQNVTECERVMERGWKNRSVGATLMNADSSRSHSIFTISMEMITNDESGQEHIRAGKLNLVDLAGSERQAKTGATGDRLKEATKINLSLSALGNVISALVDGKSKHIPYRDSKLTRLLQDSLGGNTKTLMVACLSPADNNYDETLSTLRYANRAKNIKNKPKINEDPKDALLRQYQEEIERLKAMLMGQIPVADLSDAPKSPTKQQRMDLEMEKEEIRKEYEQRMQEMEQQFEEEKTTKTKLEEDMAKLRNYYDSRLQNVDGRIADLPPTAAEEEEEGQGEAEHNADGTLVEEGAVVALAMAGAVTHAADGEVLPAGGVGPEGELAAPRDRPPSVMGREGLPRGPETSPVQGKGVAGGAVTEQQLMQLASMGLEGTGQEHLKNQHEELLHRLQELQQQMVGGENVANKEIKERRSKRKKAVEDRRRKLHEANKKMEDDGIMVGIYDSIAEELKVKNKELHQEKEVSEGLRREIIDLQSEFEFDRIDYLDTIRSQDKTIKYLEALVEKMHPCMRRDCNYSNLDKIKADSKWDDQDRKWLLPKMTVERTGLPGSGVSMPGIRGPDKSRPSMNGDMEVDDERLREKLSRSEEQMAVSYLKPKRTQQLLSSGRDIGRQADLPAEAPRELYGVTMSNGYHHQPLEEEASKELRAAQVHGQLFSEPMGRPVRLQALPSLSPAGKKSRKKRDSPF